MESVLDNVFKQISAQRRLAPGCFGWMLWRFFLIVRGCETQTKRKERGISCIAIDHSRKYHNIPQCSLFVTPKFCISIVFSFSWELKWPQEKLKTILMQNFGVINKEHYGMLWYFWSGQLQSIISDQVEAMPKEEKLVFQPLHFLAAEP